jgi:hypothetical protein
LDFKQVSSGRSIGAPKWVWFVPAGVAILALLGLVPGIYSIVRFVVFSFSLYICWLELQSEGRVKEWIVIFGLSAIIFNPLVPVFLPREIWVVLDITVAGLFLLHYVRRGR